MKNSRSRSEANHYSALEIQSYKYSGLNGFGKNPWILSILDNICTFRNISLHKKRYVKKITNLEPLFKCRQAREIENGFTSLIIQEDKDWCSSHLCSFNTETSTRYLLAHWITRTWMCYCSWAKRTNFLAEQKQNMTVSACLILNKLPLLYCLDITTDDSQKEPCKYCSHLLIHWYVPAFEHRTIFWTHTFLLGTPTIPEWKSVCTVLLMEIMTMVLLSRDFIYTYRSTRASNHVVRDSSVVRRHYIFLLEPSRSSKNI